MSNIRITQSKVLHSKLIQAKHRIPYWELDLDCGHKVFRIAREFWHTQPYQRTRCEHCRPTEQERGLKILLSDPRRDKLDKKPKRPPHSSNIKTCPKCHYQTRRDDVMRYHLNVSHKLAECSCGLRRMRISIPVSHEMKTLGYLMTFYCPRCDSSIRVVDGAVRPVMKEVLDRVRQSYHNVQDRKGVKPYAKALSNRGQIESATRLVACESA